MSREVHVRFCERRGVELPPATHPLVPIGRRSVGSAYALRPNCDLPPVAGAAANRLSARGSGRRALARDRDHRPLNSALVAVTTGNVRERTGWTLATGNSLGAKQRGRLGVGIQ